MQITIQDITIKSLPILKKYGIKKAALFGSYAQHLQTDNSDIDMLIQPPTDMSLLDFVGVKLDLEDALQADVDLLSYNGLSPYLRDKILSEQQIIYEATA